MTGVRPNRASLTATWVAASRSLGALLPEDARLIDDPFGLTLAGPAYEAAGRLVGLAPKLAARALPFTGPLDQLVLWMQVRTRAIDDHIAAFVRGSGRQVVLLGAGLDARAFRLDLGGARFFEVDHPATQAKKRAAIARILSASRAPAPTFVAWDFETRNLAQLPDALASAGLDRSRPTMTIWEGVTMYLTGPAVEASLAAVRAYSAPGSELTVTYFDRRTIDRPDARSKLMQSLVASVGEPFRFGWEPASFAAWMAPHGFTVLRDELDEQLVERLLPPGYRRRFAKRGAHVALLSIAS